MNENKKIMKNDGDTEKFTRLERLDSNVLHAELHFQNVFDNERVQLMVDTFTEMLLQPLDVSFRNGQYNVVDGKHRLLTIKEVEKITGKKIPVPCLVRYGLTEQEECDLFVKLAENRRRVKAMEIYHAAYEAGNTFTVSFVDTIRKVGFIFDFIDTAMNGRIHMTATPHRIFKELGNNGFEDFLTLLYKTWNGNKDFLGRDFMNGMYEFYKEYKNDINEKKFMERLSILTKDEVDSAISKSNRKDKAKIVAVKIFQKYNKNKRTYPNNILEERKYFYMD